MRWLHLRDAGRDPPRLTFLAIGARLVGAGRGLRRGGERELGVIVSSALEALALAFTSRR
jgi:hypothetical protein